MTKIDEILDTFAVEIGEDSIVPYDKGCTNAKSALYDLILKEVVGEDDDHTANGRLTAYKRGRKSLRAEQRQKAKELFDGVR